MRPVALACDTCGLKVEGTFVLNEFARLSPEDLHFLRTFVNCEGRVRDMETALGLSYPTVRARLSAFKQRLSALAATPGSGEPPLAQDPPPSEPSPAMRVLQRLKDGAISYAEAVNQLKSLSRKGGAASDAATSKRGRT